MAIAITKNPFKRLMNIKKLTAKQKLNEIKRCRFVTEQLSDEKKEYGHTHTHTKQEE